MADAGYLELEEGAEPSTPAANLHKVFVDQVDDKLKHKRPDGVVVDLEDAGGTVTSVDVSVPAGEFTSTGGPITSSGTIAINKTNQNSNTVWAGPTTGSPNPPTFRSLVSDDIPNIDASKITTGTLPVSRGGTGSSTTLNNNRVMQSFGGNVVEANAITASRALVSDTNGIPTHSTTTSTELGYVSGVTSAIQTQLNGKVGIIQEEGSSLPAEPIVNFRSAYITAADDPGNTRTNVTFDINSATQLTGVNTDMVSDFIPIYDTSAATHYKIAPRSINIQTVPSYNWVVYEDFNNVVASYNGGLVDVNAGTGTGATVASLVDTIHIGLLQCGTGSTATGRCAVWNGGNGVVFGNGIAIFESCVQLNALSDGTDTYTLRIGFGDAVNGEPTDGVYFRYTHSANSGNWVGVGRSNNIETLLNSSTVVVAGAFMRLRIEINSDASVATFYVNGTSIGTVTSNIPQTAARETGIIHAIQKSVGTAARNQLIDYIMAYKQITTQR